MRCSSETKYFWQVPFSKNTSYSSRSSTSLLIMLNISTITGFYHSCLYGFDKTVVFATISTILTIRELAFESEGRVKRVEQRFVNDNLCKEPIKRREAVGFFYQNFGTLYQHWNNCAMIDTYGNNSFLIRLARYFRVLTRVFNVLFLFIVI